MSYDNFLHNQITKSSPTKLQCRQLSTADIFFQPPPNNEQNNQRVDQTKTWRIQLPLFHNS